MTTRACSPPGSPPAQRRQRRRLLRSCTDDCALCAPLMQAAMGDDELPGTAPTSKRFPTQNQAKHCYMCGRAPPSQPVVTPVHRL